MTPRYLVAGCTTWAKRIFDKTLSKLSGEWFYLDAPEKLAAHAMEGFTLLTPMRMDAPKPTYIFFLHWRWKVPAEIVNKYECIGFHLSDLPHGRGGSPVQWAILEGGNPRLQGQEWVKAFRLTDGMDEGPIYDKRLVSLHGTAEVVFARAMCGAAEIIESIVRSKSRPNPYPQSLEPSGMLQGESVRKRRTPEDSRIPTTASLEKVYDWIRCVDAPDYPKAFIEYGGLRFTFSRAVMYDGRMVADCEIIEMPHE